MTAGTARAVQIVLAGTVVGGGTIILFPNHAESVVRVLLGLAAAVALLHLLARVLPGESLLVDSEFTGREGQPRTPPDSAGAGGAATVSSRLAAALSGELDDPIPLADLARLRSRLGERRRRIPGAPSHMPAIPAELVRILRGLLRRALEQDGLDPGRADHVEAIRRRLGPQSRAILACPPLDHRGRLRTKRPDEHASARVVHAVLDDLARMGPGTARTPDPDRHPASAP